MVLLVIDPNVLVSGLITRGSPAEIVDLVRVGEVRAVVCPHLLVELEAVLRRPRFRRYVEPEEIDEYLALLRTIPTAWPDAENVDGIECRDPEDAYLIALAREADADALVSGDRDLTDLLDPRPPILTPGEVLDRWDPVPRQPFRAVPGTFAVVLEGPKGAERRVHRALQASGFLTQRTTGTEDNPSTAWVEALCHGGEHPSGDFQAERLNQAQVAGAEEGYQLRSHGVVIGGPAQPRIVRHRRTGEELFRLFADNPQRGVSELARQLGIPTEELLVEEPPDPWDVPDR